VDYRRQTSCGPRTIAARLGWLACRSRLHRSISPEAPRSDLSNGRTQPPSIDDLPAPRAGSPDRRGRRDQPDGSSCINLTPSAMRRNLPRTATEATCELWRHTEGNACCSPTCTGRRWTGYALAQRISPGRGGALAHADPWPLPTNRPAERGEPCPERRDIDRILDQAGAPACAQAALDAWTADRERSEARSDAQPRKDICSAPHVQRRWTSTDAEGPVARPMNPKIVLESLGDYSGFAPELDVGPAPRPAPAATLARSAR